MGANTKIKRQAEEVLSASVDDRERLLNNFLNTISDHGYRKYRDLYLKWRDYGKPIQTRNVSYPPLEDQSERAPEPPHKSQNEKVPEQPVAKQTRSLLDSLFDTEIEYNDNVISNNIILIGPSGVGKSTIAKELASKTGMPILSFDEIASRNRRTGYVKNFNNIEEHNLYMIYEAIRRTSEPQIWDMGAGHTVYDDKQIFAMVKKGLEPFSHIILLLPSENILESLTTINARSTGDIGANLKFLVSPCNKELATHIIYTNGKTPDMISDEIIALINDKDLRTSPKK